MNISAKIIVIALAATALIQAAPRPESGIVTVQVTEARSAKPLPCRITVLTDRGLPAALSPKKAPHIAYRPGVIYTGSGAASFTAPPGRYSLYVTRGLEYGLAARALEIASSPVHLDVRLEREVKTDGYIAADTHIHTLTHSGHGDATMEERMATIAGEGIELAVATDHNHHTDYAPTMRQTGTAGHFTPLIGNEVTTPAGHFNAFPIEPGSTVPDYRSTDWKQLLAGIRAVPGVKVIVLNHPSNLHSGFKPTDRSRFHAHSGESLDKREWDFDGIEIVTSAALQSDIIKPLRDWFAILNSGRRMTGIGSSDTHEVNAYILGQGRTYVASKASRPHQINVDEVCANLKAGRALVSMGLLTEAWVDSGVGVGGLARNLGSEVSVKARVQAPRWIQADTLELYANGIRALKQPIPATDSAVIKLDRSFRIPRPRQDAWLVVVATGPGTDKPYWPIPRPYQPTDPQWDPRVIGATNPILLDADGDGNYTSPAGYAKQAVDSAAGDLARTLQKLEAYDESVAVQAASILRSRGVDLNSARSAIDRAAPHVRHAFVAYMGALP